MSNAKKALREKYMQPSTKKDKNMADAIHLLADVFDRIEGRHSNIPDCCIETFVAGRTYQNFLEELSEKEQRKLSGWGYVPCDDCFKKNKKNKISMNGTSELGQMILAIQQIIIKKADLK